MKWLVYAVSLWCLSHFCQGGVLKCTADSQDEACAGQQQQELVPDQPQLDTERGKDIGEPECLAGSEWESNCHYCRCSDDGVAECLRQDTCAGTYAEPIQCKPNTTFQRGCNTCVCLDNGLGLCTLEACSRAAIKKSELPAGRDCLPNTFWKSKCNDCGCSPNGAAYCTEKACPGQEDEPEMDCAPDTIWKNECNTCWCTSNGHALCTKIGCMNFNFAPTTPSSENAEDREAVTPVEAIDDEETLNSLQTESTIHKLHEKLEGSENTQSEIVKVEDFGTLQNAESKINKRVENYEVAQETEKDQKTGNPKDDIELVHELTKRSNTCKPYEDFKVDCNACKCSSDSQSYTCTQNECMDKDHRDMSKEVEVFMENEGVDHVEKHSVCKPGGTFYIGCNTCRCNYDGTDYSCTNKPCPLPEDVEIFHELREMKPIVPFKEDGKQDKIKHL